MPFLPDVVMLGQFPLAVGALTGLLGGFAAYWLSGYAARHAGTDVEVAKDLVFNLLIGGFLGANPVALLLFPYGPLAVPAGIVGGLTAAVWTLRHHPDRTSIIDAVALPLVLGLGIALVGWKEPGSWALAPGLIAAALVTHLSAPKASMQRGGRAAHTIVLAGLAIVLADLARPVSGLGGGVTPLQLVAAIAATAAWFWLRKQTPEAS
jgi:hypothetical protein